ncbi:MAG: cytidine deaminase [Candidatus Aenigmarchaeota archaeon]|nr:cytidine deaminase [Candidatus Aenigmarchaeota archaeon]
MTYRDRLTWDQMFMKITEILAERTSCINHQIGSVFVDDQHRIVTVGYNGATRGDVNCNEVGCAKVHGEDGKLKRCRGAHSEINAIINCIQPERLRNTTLYITTFPCYDCMKALVQIGVRAIIYKEEYRRVVNANDYEKEDEAWELANKMGIKVFKYENGEKREVFGKKQ